MIMIEKNTLYLFIYNCEETCTNTAYPLTPFEHEKSQRISFKKSSTYLKQRQLIRQSLINIQLLPELLNYTPHGKPYLPAPYQISISHSNQWLIVGIIKASILGIDLQIAPPQHPLKLINRFGLAKMSTHDLLKHWTLAEATAKAYNQKLLYCLYHPKKIIHEQNGYYFSLHNPHFSAVSDIPILHQAIFYPKNHSRLW